MTSAEALLAQLAELNEWSRSYGRQFWQVSVGYVAGVGFAAVQAADGRHDVMAAPVTLLLGAGVGVFVIWHLAALYRARQRTDSLLEDLEAKLSLSRAPAGRKSEDLLALLALTVLVSAMAFIGGAYLFVYWRAMK